MTVCLEYTMDNVLMEWTLSSWHVRDGVHMKQNINYVTSSHSILYDNGVLQNQRSEFTKE